MDKYEQLETMTAEELRFRIHYLESEVEMFRRLGRDLLEQRLNYRSLVKHAIETGELDELERALYETQRDVSADPHAHKVLPNSQSTVYTDEKVTVQWDPACFNYIKVYLPSEFSKKKVHVRVRAVE